VRPHERHDPSHAAALRAKMVADGQFTHPICLDRQTLTLLDGHHRFHAGRMLGFQYVPSVLIDYEEDADVIVIAWRTGEIVNRQNVLAAAASGNLMPIKTSRHIFKSPVGECRVPLRRLCKSFLLKYISASEDGSNAYQMSLFP